MRIKITETERTELENILSLISNEVQESYKLGINLLKKYKNYNLVTPILCKDDLIDPFDDDLAIFKFSALMKDEDRYGILYFLESVVNEVDCFYQK